MNNYPEHQLCWLQFDASFLVKICQFLWRTPLSGQEVPSWLKLLCTGQIMSAPSPNQSVQIESIPKPTQPIKIQTSP